MLALAAARLGVRTRCLDSNPGAVAGHVAELVVADMDTPGSALDAALDVFCDGLTAATYEFENVPIGVARQVAERVPTFPDPRALETAQDRLAEKSAFLALGIPTPAFAPVDRVADAEAFARQHGLPMVLKTRRMGYDGKGQRVVRESGEIEPAVEGLGGNGLIAEAFVPFDRECSVLLARSRDGQTRAFPLCANAHVGGILDVTRAPAGDAHAELAAKLAEHLGYVGVLALELFDVGGRMLANEFAPRVHNSGHWTQDGCATDQFEQHVRSVLGLPLGAVDPLGACAMVNLVGEVPELSALCAIPGARVHLYGKTPRPGRKLGHVNLVAPDEATLGAMMRRVRTLVRRA